MRARPYQEWDTGAWVNTMCPRCDAPVDLNGLCEDCDAELLDEMRAPQSTGAQVVADPWGS